MEPNNSANDNNSGSDDRNNNNNNNNNNDKSNGNKSNSESAKIKNALTKSVTSTESSVCRVCTNEILNRSLTDTCLHEFCFNCLYRWSRQHNVCPFCRQLFRNIICNIRRENDFDQIPVDAQIGNIIAANNPRNADEALYNNNEILLQQYSILRNLAISQLTQLNAQLNTFDRNSYEALEIQQRIAVAEQRRDHATEMIDQMFAAMVRLNANLVRQPRNAAGIRGSRLAYRGVTPGQAVPAFAYNLYGRPIGPLPQQPLAIAAPPPPPPLPSLMEVISPTPTTPPLEIATPTPPIANIRSPAETVESFDSDEVEVINVVINNVAVNQNQDSVQLSSGQNAENDTTSSNSNQTEIAVTTGSSTRNSADNNGNTNASDSTVNIVADRTVGTVQQEVVSQAMDNTLTYAQQMHAQDINSDNSSIDAIQIPIPLGYRETNEQNNSSTENLVVNQSNADTNQNNANNNNNINDGNANVENSNNQQNENSNNNDEPQRNIPILPIAPITAAEIIVNDNGAQTGATINQINVAANDNDSSSSHNTIVQNTSIHTNNSTQQQQQQQQQQQPPENNGN